MSTASWRTWLILLPAAVLGIVVVVANLTPVQVSLDPFSQARPALAMTVPLYAVIFAAFLLGLLAGGFGAWLGQGGMRRDRRAARRELKRLSRAPSAAGEADLPAATPALPHANRHGG